MGILSATKLRFKAFMDLSYVKCLKTEIDGKPGLIFIHCGQ